MNHSLVTADRSTHLKIVVVSLCAAIIVVAVGIAARFSDSNTATAGVEPTVIKAGHPVTITHRDGTAVR